MFLEPRGQVPKMHYIERHNVVIIVIPPRSKLEITKYFYVEGAEKLENDEFLEAIR